LAELNSLPGFGAILGNVKMLLKDLRAVWKRGWKFIVGGGVISALTASAQVYASVHGHHGWHPPSAWWLVFLFVGWAIAAQLVVKDRREERDDALSERDEAREKATTAARTIKHEHSPMVVLHEVGTTMMLPAGLAVSSSSESVTFSSPSQPRPFAVEKVAEVFTEQLARNDIERQDEVLRKLHRAYLEGNPNASEAIRNGKEPLPKKWVEARLAELGEEWRRESYEL
jgi:hypothetical protein